MWTGIIIGFATGAVIGQLTLYWLGCGLIAVAYFATRRAESVMAELPRSAPLILFGHARIFRPFEALALPDARPDGTF